MILRKKKMYISLHNIMQNQKHKIILNKYYFISCNFNIILIAFSYFMKPENVYFEFGSGGSTNLASFYKVKTFSVESDVEWHEKLKKSGIKANYITIDLKVENFGYPGNNTNLEDWKKYIQAYKHEYNANVFL